MRSIAEVRNAGCTKPKTQYPRPGTLFRAGVVCALALLVAACSERRSEQHRLEGDAYFQLKKYAEAADAYRKADAANPNNAMAKVGLGRCLLVQQQFDEALAQFRKAVELDSGCALGYVEAVNVLLRKDRGDEALQLSDRFASVNPEKGGPLHAFVLLRAGHAADAVALLTRLRDQFPQSADMRVNLATALLTAKQPDKAEAELNTVLEKIDPKSMSARMALVDVYKTQGKADAVVAQFQKLVDENPNEVAPMLGLARSLVAVGRSDEAKAIAQRVLDQDPKSGWANYVMGSCLVEKKQYPEAVPYLEAAAEVLPAEADVSRQLSIARSGGQGTSQRPAAPEGKSARPQPAEDWTTLWQQGAVPRLLQNRDAFLAKKDPNVRETLVVAALLAHAYPLAEELTKGLPEDSPFRNWIGVMKQKELNEVLKQYESWKEEDLQRQLLRDTAFAVTLARGGARARALQVYSKCLQIWPDQASSLFGIAQVFREAGMPEFAARALQRLITKYPNTGDVHTLLYATLREAGMLREARNAAEAAYSLFPTSREAIMNLAQAYFETKDAELAKKVLERGLETMPDDVGIKFELANIQMFSNAPEEARKTLEHITPPANLAVRRDVAMAMCAALQGQWPKVIELGERNEIAAVGPVMRFLMAAAYVNANRTEDAAKVLTASDPNKPVAGRVADVILEALGKPAKSLSDHEKALAQTLAQNPAAIGDFLYASACQASQLHDAALAGFRKLEGIIGANPRFIQLIYFSLAQARSAAKPAEVAQAFAERHADSPAAWIGVAMVMRALSDVDGERKALDKAAEVAPKDPDVWFQRSQFFDRQKDMKAMAEANQHLLELNPDDPVANNNLAYCLLMTGGDVQDALARASKANEKIPGNANILHTLGVAQLRAGQLDESKRNLSVALELRPGDPTLLLDFGQLQIAQNQTEEGKKNIQLAIRYADQLGLDFPRRAEAEKLVGASVSS